MELGVRLESLSPQEKHGSTENYRVFLWNYLITDFVRPVILE